jgi:Virulence-associated protein E/Primase C terminal 2 (PriCT-2)/RepB DNA-primase from phage plasmid
MLDTNANDGTAQNKCGGATSMIERRIMRHFLDTLANEPGSAFQFSMIRQMPGQRDTGRTIDRYGTLSDCYSWIEEHSQKGYSAYVVVNETDGSGERKAKNIIAARAVWNDCDHGIADNYPLEPTLRVHTSKGKAQDYWLLDGPMELTVHDQAIDAIVANHNGDKGCKGRPRILRLPGSLNWKYGAPQLVTLEKKSGEGYTAAQIVEAFPPLTKGKPVKTAVVSTDVLPASLSMTSSTKRYTLDEVADALALLDADDRAEWVRYGTAIKRDHGPDGLPVWLEWSAKSALFDNADARVRWNGFDVSDAGPDKVTCGTIIHLAKVAKAREAAIVASDIGGTVKELADNLVHEFAGKSLDPSSIKNVAIFLHTAGITPWHNEFDHNDYLRSAGGHDTKLSDKSALDLRMRLNKAGIRVSAEFCNDTIMWMASSTTAHPVCNYLADLKWDGTPRLDGMLHSYFGAADTPYHRLIGSMFMIAAVRRVRKPGCKFDTSLILDGPQNAGKSSGLRILGSPEEGSTWFSDGVAVGSGPKETIELTRGKWIVEMAELAGLSKRDVNEVKQALSKEADQARLSYGRFSTEVPRQFVFCGTTNNTQYLKDKTGNRRFWCVTVGRIDLKALKRDRDHLWAEAAQREAEGALIYLQDSEYDLAVEEQAKREEDDDLEIAVEDLLVDFEDHVVVKSDLYKALGHENVFRGSGSIGPRVASVMEKFGWKSERVSRDTGRHYCFVKGAGQIRLNLNSSVIGKRLVEVKERPV